MRPAADSEQEVGVEAASGTGDGGFWFAPEHLGPGSAGAAWDETVYGLDRGLGLLMDDDPLDAEETSSSDDEDHYEEDVEIRGLDDWHDNDRFS